jgi:hypothetical protein
MATYTKRILSGSTSGRGILVVATTSPGTSIHTAVSGSTDMDEIWLYAFNETAADIVTTFQFGGTTVLGDDITCTIPTKSGLQLVVPGLLLNGGTLVKCFAATASGVIIQGFVNRITA